MNRKFFSCFLIIASCLSLFTQAQMDGTQFPLNDPRNPNCPCHKQQQQADEEYRQLLNNSQLKNVNPKNINNQPLPIPNQMADVPKENNLFVQAENNFVPVSTQLASAPINKPEIIFSLNITKPSFGSYSGSGTHKYKKHHWRKFSFKTKRKFKKVFPNQKKIKVNYNNCFKW